MAVQYTVIISYMLLGLIQNTACMCNITCTTDYYSSLNCSCSEQSPLSAFTLMAQCWNEYDHVGGSCEIIPPQRWCQAKMEEFDLVVAVDTHCSVRVNNTNSDESKTSADEIYFDLYEHVKPAAPFNVKLTESSNRCNISWEMFYKDDENIHLNTYLFYMVRIRTTGCKPKYYYIKEDRRYLEIPCDDLKDGVEYIVDVQATVNPDQFQAFWSEWSTPFVWKASNKRFFYLCLILFSVIPPLLLYCFRKIEWLKRLHLSYHIPSPEDFFKPLYHTYQGDFKQWVGPTFALSEFDLLEKNIVVQVVKEKTQPSLEKLCNGNDEDGSHRDSREGRGPGSSSLLSLSSQCSSMDLLSGNSGQDKVRTTGLISIHTVTVSGEESAASGYPEDSNRGNFCAYLGDCEGVGLGQHSMAVMEEENALSRAGWPQNESHLEPYNVDWQLAAGDLEAERVSLDSFCSNERSDDGYPPLELDLDTIDSGFLDSDCNSPVETELTGKTLVLGKEESPQSNYIRQWVTYGPTTGALGNSTS